MSSLKSLNCYRSKWSSLIFQHSPEGIHHKANFSPHSKVQPGQFVWLRVDRVRQLLEAPYQGPHKILDTSDSVVNIEFPDGSSHCVSQARIKIAKLSSPNRNKVEGSSNHTKVKGFNSTIPTIPPDLQENYKNYQIRKTSDISSEYCYYWFHLLHFWRGTTL